ncbi:MAG: hypothetical protein OEX04_11050 [Acidimicrobiia bacterium]|nr:hypothetical protein [Acidimicrobiia bacterium]MDH4308006.1 hypothetical protein [Acidimicrobiia bacterium]MDH5293520.1 hypothetical protein [Acidimicrobiia bacterium]
MNKSVRPLIARHVGALMLLAMLTTSCLAGPSEASSVSTMLDAAEKTHLALGTALGVAVNTGQTMSEEFRSAQAQAAAELTAFNAATADFKGEQAIKDAGESYAQAANLVLGLLEDGTTDVASEVKRTQADVKFDLVHDLLAARQNDLGGPTDGRSASPILKVVFGLIGLAAVVGVALRVRAAMEPDAEEEPPSQHVYDPRQPDAFSSSLPTELEEAETDPDAPPRNPEALHSVRGGLRTVELPGIIEAALATVNNAGWDAAVDCPDVRVMVDPLRMRRLLTNLLLSATAHGAEHIGLVATIEGDKVEVNVGHDGSLLDGYTEAAARENPPKEVDHQLNVARQLLNGMHADVRWTAWRGVSLYTVELVRGPEEGADEQTAVAQFVD